jgi:hypothetical protein
VAAQGTSFADRVSGSPRCRARGPPSVPGSRAEPVRACAASDCGFPPAHPPRECPAALACAEGGYRAGSGSSAVHVARTRLPQMLQVVQVVLQVTSVLQVAGHRLPRERENAGGGGGGRRERLSTGPRPGLRCGFPATKGSQVAVRKACRSVFRDKPFRVGGEAI